MTILRSPLRTALRSSVYSPLVGKWGGVDPIFSAFREILRDGASDASLLILTDSTGNANDEWVRLLDEEWAEFAPNYMVRNALYLESAGVYGSGLLGARITNDEAGTVLFEDNFNRADGALGTTTSGGQSWAANSWVIANGKAKHDTQVLLVTANAVGTDNYITEFDFVYGSNATASVRCYVEYASTSNAVLVSITANGVMTIAYLPGSVVLAQMDTGNDLADGEEINFKITVDERWVQVTARGVTLTGMLSSAQRTALTGNKVMFLATATGSALSMTWDNVRISAISQTRRLTIWNAAHPGANAAYHIAEIATTSATSAIGTADLAIIALGHNEGTDDVATFQGNLDDLVTALRAEQAGIPIAMMMQNPQISPATNAAAHNARQESLPAYAAARGYGLINPYSSYDPANIAVDGVHPDATGSIFIKDRVATKFGI